MIKVRVIGAGLAGCEAAWQLAKRGIEVELWEMKPEKKSPAHKSENFAELVCSNSLRGDALSNAVGLLKEELRRLDSLILSCAEETRVPAGGALAVDRDAFSTLVTEKIKACPNITVKYGEVVSLRCDIPTIVASGPLTSDALAEEIHRLLGESYLSFYDAAAPIVSFDSIDMESAYFKSRYDKGTADYINAPMSREEYEVFWNELCNAEEALIHGFEDKKVFEGCMPVEVMARRGHDTLLFGPLKPVGLEDPKTGKEPYAVVQLRKDNAAGTLYNLVGFQTHLKFPEQKRVFSLIPALKNAEFVRYGVMHRNTYLNAPLILDDDFSCKKIENLYFAGQMTGVEGYVESTASGFVAGVTLARKLLDLPKIDFPQETALGALGKYIANADPQNFQPMNINYGLLPPLGYRVKGKKFKNEALANRALEILDKIEC